MLQNAYLLAKIGADTAENERNFAEICQKFATTLRVRRPPPRGPEGYGLCAGGEAQTALATFNASVNREDSTDSKFG